MSASPSPIAEMPTAVGNIVAGIFDDKTISQITMLALNPEQRSYLDALPQPTRDLAYEWVMASVRTAARWQVAFVCQVGISQPALERLVGDAQVEVGRRQRTTQLASQLVAAGANFAAARALLGINRAEFEYLRKGQDLPDLPARKAVGDAESTRIYRQWETLGKPADAEGFLSLHAQSGQPIYVLWGLVQDWRHALSTVKG